MPTDRLRLQATRNSHGCMMRRCYSLTAKDYKYYGGRGIRVCRRWHKFENFLADMGLRPLTRTLDREDNEGNYTPGNCRWATFLQQQRNRRHRRSGLVYKLSGRPYRPRKSTRISIPSRVRQRLARGWPMKLATDPRIGLKYHGPRPNKR